MVVMAGVAVVVGVVVGSKRSSSSSQGFGSKLCACVLIKVSPSIYEIHMIFVTNRKKSLYSSFSHSGSGAISARMSASCS